MSRKFEKTFVYSTAKALKRFKMGFCDLTVAWLHCKSCRIILGNTARQLCGLVWCLCIHRLSIWFIISMDLMVPKHRVETSFLFVSNNTENHTNMNELLFKKYIPFCEYIIPVFDLTCTNKLISVKSVSYIHDYRT